MASVDNTTDRNAGQETQSLYGNDSTGTAAIAPEEMSAMAAAIEGESCKQPFRLLTVVPEASRLV